MSAIEPLKSGQGMLRLSVVEVLQPMVPRRRSITLRVRHRAAEYLIGTLMDVQSTEQTVILSVMSYAWMEAFCHDWWRRFPMRHFAPYHYEPDGIDVQTYLGRAFPGEPGKMAEPVVLAPAKLRPMPAARAQLMVRHEFGPMDSYLIRRGFKSSVMEEKWDAEFSGNCLRLYRSWTGIMIFELPMTVRGACLYAGAVYVNRDPEEHASRDDDFDKAMAGYVISRVLLGLPADFPTSGNMNPDQALIAAWAVAGTASQ
ncbi:hypothetical protein [Roseomonas gilardii]|uniref:hypothetical protein n=1 Tax=Roseomonas gilardii TaxID=257708 RepID=UPI0011A302F8|nr:hypothetical protein [Roseomonas gilardii]